MTFGSNLIVEIGRVVLGFRHHETLHDSAQTSRQRIVG
jgi:hypothetical protein